MNFTKEIAKYLSCEQKREVSVGKIVFKTIAITAAVLAFVPTVFVKKENGFDAYGLLSRVGYEKSIDESGKPHHNIVATLIDLSRYGVGQNEGRVEEENENSISIEK